MHGIPESAKLVRELLPGCWMVQTTRWSCNQIGLFGPTILSVSTQSPNWYIFQSKSSGTSLLAGQGSHPGRRGIHVEFMAQGARCGSQRLGKTSHAECRTQIESRRFLDTLAPNFLICLLIMGRGKNDGRTQRRKASSNTNTIGRRQAGAAGTTGVSGSVDC